MDTSYYIDTRARKILRKKEKKVSKAERIIAYIMQQLSLIGESFGWQIGRIGANYENGYMKSNQDCKAHFRKEKIKKDIEAIINDHSGEVNGMVVNEDKKRMLGKCIYHRCSYGECDECEFFNAWDKTDGDYFCAIRDKDGNIPYYQNWDMESALGMEHIREVAKKVDLVAVVRCKDCKHWGTGVQGETDNVKCCEYAKYMSGANGFCIYGEQVK